MHPNRSADRSLGRDSRAAGGRDAAAGLFGHSIPVEYGGGGLATEELALVNIEVSRAAAVFRARFGGNTGIASEALIADGTPEQKATWLPRLASGEITGCFALTEPNAGSDATALQTAALREGGGWRLSGVKCYITNAPIADLFTIFARTGQEARGARGIRAFLVPRGTPGLSTPEAMRKMGQHGSPVGEGHLQDCRVPDSAILGGLPGTGFRSAMKALNKQRINLAAQCVGPALRLVDEMCKLFASEACGRIADRAVQVMGGAGYVAGNVAERFYRDVRLFRLYEGTSQIHILNIARLMQTRQDGRECGQ